LAARPPSAEIKRDAEPIGGGFHGRGKVKRLSPSRKSLVAGEMPNLRVDLPALKASGGDLSALFDFAPQALVLEIGFGGGEHLLHRAQESPETGFIGVEPFVNGMAKAVAGVAARGLRNVRLYDRDAAELIAALPPGAFDIIYLLYPDPWPKRRHNKRRFVNQGSLKAFRRLLKTGGRFRFASDIDDYVGWTLAHVERSGLFAWGARSATDWLTPYPGWPGTRYEAKALREGRVPTYLDFLGSEFESDPDLSAHPR
jgi:tRNA (guanine-N7-)-methyltransferase